MKVKICGIKTETAAAAVESGHADYMGVVFVKERKRYLEPSKAAGLFQNHPNIKKVGVFVDDSIERIHSITKETKLDYVQLHGHEDMDYARQIHVPVIKAFRWNEDFDVEIANTYPCQIVLIDSFEHNMNGGSGKAFCWQDAAAAIKRIRKPVLIAGGVSEENIEELIRYFPYDNIGVDVSSSLEVNGSKSPEKIRTFLEKVKQV